MVVRLEKFNRVVALILIAAICSCSMDISGPESLSERLLVARSARLMELYLDEVSRVMTDDELPGFKEAYERGFSAEDVARRTLEEENGRKYLEFTLYSDDYESVDEVLSAAAVLAPDEDLSAIRADIEELETRLYDAAEEDSRLMTAAQKKAFYSELRKLVVKAAVLLTAAIVYACVPNLMFWGKVSAASADNATDATAATTINDTAGAEMAPLAPEAAAAAIALEDSIAAEPAEEPEESAMHSDAAAPLVDDDAPLSADLIASELSKASEAKPAPVKKRI